MANQKIRDLETVTDLTAKVIEVGGAESDAAGKFDASKLVHRCKNGHILGRNAPGGGSAYGDVDDITPQELLIMAGAPAIDATADGLVFTRRAGNLGDEEYAVLGEYLLPNGIADKSAAQAGTSNVLAMTPLRALEAQRFVDRLLITEDVFLGGSWWLMINASRANRIITRVSLALTGLTLGSMPVPIVYLSRYTLLPRDTSPDPAWAISGGLTDVGIGDWTDTALSKDGLSFAWDAGVRIKMAFQANWGPYDVLSSTTGAEVEVEWRAA